MRVISRASLTRVIAQYAELPSSPSSLCCTFGAATIAAHLKMRCYSCSAWIASIVLLKQHKDAAPWAASLLRIKQHQ
jgi:hypothetical protein